MGSVVKRRRDQYTLVTQPRTALRARLAKGGPRRLHPRSGERSYRRQTVAVFTHAVSRSEKEICKNVPPP